MYAYEHLLIFPTEIDVTPTGFKDLADVFLQRCHPYGVQETFAERVCRDLQQIPRNVPKLTSMVRLGTVPTGPGEYAVRNADRIWASTPQNRTYRACDKNQIEEWKTE